MKVVREICVAGKVIDVSIKVSSGDHRSKRTAKQFRTSDKVKKNNDRLAIRHLTRLINTNFDSSCWHLTLTYEGMVPTPEKAERLYRNFVRTLKREMKNRGMELKWVVAIEYENVRPHHHFITNAPLELVREKWKHGIVLARPFDINPNYQKLADYIIKETSEKIGPDCERKVRYRHSRNLTVPEVRKEEVSGRMLSEEPQAWKGYYIDQDSIRKFEHPITGIEHLEYSMVSLAAEPRLKKYYKGKKTKSKAVKEFKIYESQISMWTYIEKRAIDELIEEATL